MSIADEGQQRRNAAATVRCRHCKELSTQHVGSELWCLFSPTRFEPMTVQEWTMYKFYGERQPPGWKPPP